MAWKIRVDTVSQVTNNGTIEVIFSLVENGTVRFQRLSVNGRIETLYDAAVVIATDLIKEYQKAGQIKPGDEFPVPGF